MAVPRRSSGTGAQRIPAPSNLQPSKPKRDSGRQANDAISGQLEQHDLGFARGANLKEAFIAHGRTVARVQPLSVERNLTSQDLEPGVPVALQFMGKVLAAVEAR